MKKALIVIDMQNDFIGGSLGTREAQAIVPKMSQSLYKVPTMRRYFLHETPIAKIILIRRRAKIYLSNIV